jgi:hypothetical protein
VADTEIFWVDSQKLLRTANRSRWPVIVDHLSLAEAMKRLWLVLTATATVCGSFH